MGGCEHRSIGFIELDKIGGESSDTDLAARDIEFFVIDAVESSLFFSASGVDHRNITKG